MIRESAHHTIEREIKMVDEMEIGEKKEATNHNGFFPFAIRLRAKCVQAGIGDYGYPRLGLSESMDGLAHEIIDYIMRGNENRAAELMQDTFFPRELDIEKPEEGKFEYEEGEGSGFLFAPKMLAHSDKGSSAFVMPTMEIVDLPKSQAIKNEAIGTRVSNSGSRLYRRALRKTPLPQRIFIRRARKHPGGTILVDASSSMGGWENIIKWCEESPAATLAYYAGNDNSSGPRGQLYIYARDGYRCDHLIEPPDRGNSIDGLAIDWLMQQDGPRVMITDREFCGCYDSHMQVVRLERLEKLGEVTVRDYREKKDDE